jgi:hypothetical protein
MDAGTEQPILEQVRTKGNARSHGCDFKQWREVGGRDTRAVGASVGGENGQQRDVLRGGRRVAPLVSTEYSMNVSRARAFAQGWIARAGQKE